MSFKQATRSAGKIAIALTLIYLVLLIPESKSGEGNYAEAEAFVWAKDDLWNSLEKTFAEIRGQDTTALDSILESHQKQINQLLHELLGDRPIQYHDDRLEILLNQFFSITPVVAARNKPDGFLSLYNQIRAFIKVESQQWDLNKSEQRAVVYSMLYGMRAAVEEVLLQADTINFEPIQLVTDEASATPSAVLQGIKVHSGDLLLSRGGAEVSAFISRGNDYPGNFSHVALLYVDESDHKPYFIEAHIEKGVAIASAEEYLKDRKLRFMVLRPRADLRQLQVNPALPHLAALTALGESDKRHIPYDFKMDFYDSSAMFCSEVGSFAYKKHGLQLWQAPSTISSRGTASWLNTFGVENFVTQMPSDLEYDPQLAIVAEWSDPETLFKDHLDNAVMDALLEKANEGMEIDHAWWLLPVARIIKGYSWIQNLAGKPGIIPEGMSATTALKNNSFVSRYQQVKKLTEEKIEIFSRQKGYRPPYWQLVKFAEESCCTD